jgi:hypothetical protein
MQVLDNIWQLWKRFGQLIGDLIARVVLTLFYFTIFTPFGLGVHFFADPLDTKRSGNSKWTRRTTSDRELHDARRLS